FLTYLEEIGRVWKNKDNYVDVVMELLLDRAEPNVGLLTEISGILLDSTNEIPKYYQMLEEYLRDSLTRKRKSLARISQKEEIKNWEENSLSILGAGIYTYLRTLYNQTSFEQQPQLKTVLYLFIREYAYSSMFRYNADGMFNVPFGGNSYAKKDFQQRFNQITDGEVVDKLRNTTILQGDFSDAFIDQEGAFMFLDPPYDSEFSTYNLHVFDAQEQIRLRNKLLQVKQTKWLMVVKSTDFIEELYEHDNWYKFRFDKSYSVNFKNRNEQNVKHLVITNYQLEEI
ncbi:DNA adenine methylase, partial [Streptococcus pneumoniae]